MNKKLIDWWTGGASFTPASLSPLAWFDNGSAYMASDGSQWTDRANGNNMTAVGTARPTYNASSQGSRPSFSFDGSTDYLLGPRLASLEGATKCTLWLVYKRGSFGLNTNPPTTTAQFNLYGFSDGNDYAHVASGSGTFGSVAQANNYRYEIMVFDGTQTGNANRLRLFVNGTQQTLSFTGTIPAQIYSVANMFISMGKSASSFIAGEISEAGIVADAITSQNITNLGAYLSSRYSI